MFQVIFFAKASLSAAPGLPKNKNVQFIDEGLRGRVEHNFSPDQMKSIENKAEKHEFETEISKLMNILIDSLYENKDIFLREVISNANDALDKIRFQAIKDHKALDQGNRELQILIDVNEDDRTITVTDTGIGMTKRDLIENLGRIARSGTSEFKKMIQSGDTSLIGQFGVGFYSTFLVADKVTVISKHNDDPKQWIWTSDSSAQYTIAEDPRGVTLGRGTQIIMHIKEKDYQYLNRDRLIAIARHYSMFVDFPIKIWQYHEEKICTDEIPEAESSETTEDDIFDSQDTVKDEDSDEEIVTIATPEDRASPKKIVWEWEQINNRQPIWMRDRNDISELEYNEFYKGAFKDTKNPMFKIHTCEEGRITFNALLYIPSTAPSSDKMMQHTTRNVKLYVKRVLVSDEWNDELLPDYLHFIKGVIDSSDLSLNVDRDHLSKEGTLTLIKRRITNKIISELQHSFQFEPGLYFQFYKQYSAALKYGVIQDQKNKNSLAKLLLFYTSYSPNSMVTLDEYVSRMKTGQDKIYFIGSANRESAAVSPYLESLYSRGIEVIFAIEPIDLYCLERMDTFDGYKFENPETQNDKGSLTKDLMACNLTQREWSVIQRWFKKVLGDKIEKVSLSSRLKSTPAICTATNWGYTASHERLIRAQTVYDQKLTDNLQMNKKILEMNPEHPTIIELFDRIKNNEKDPQLVEDAKLIFETGLLAGGFTIDGVLNYTLNVFKMLGRSNGIEQKVKEFEEANKVYYTTMEDEFKATTNIPKRQKPKKADKKRETKPENVNEP
ncbi:Hsp90 protein [Trichomonas vaginalis G3]|uniref:Hsp90 protein n=1 Tax=Trichomonas vaginalis (strain ATCC PRA-98 / G3) TaxID=412133 RepID=A2EYI9_TRIV3|nr:HSP90/HTPG type heat shock protein family [Trichomonas vaginalis G3]EAY02265.1 Hsp90 protein [Trichomonas vaginalis G3]KAI5522907.1 HSP90/HTPG type heat shock protein family [Trichomonas vaginalis G3]|eukprot:XP_001314582.1 Hsp90 protein [Trichomonas vaginalis G3]